MSAYNKLDKIVVAMTIADRKAKNKSLANEWISRGFSKMKKANLIKYWENRISSNPEDLQLYNTTLERYEKVIKYQNTPNSDKQAEDIKAPGVWDMIKTATKAGKNFVKSGMRFVSEDEFIARENICKSCEYWNPKGYANTGQCLLCGCATKAKLRLASESCPVKKWDKVIPNVQEHQ